MTTEAPRDLRYSANDGEKYRNLTHDELSPFKGADFKDVFVYAAAYGFAKGLRKEVERGQANIPLSAFSKEDIWLIKSLAIAEKGSLDVLDNEREIYRMAEEYANGALEEIYLEIFGGKPGEPYKRMLLDIWDEAQRIGVVKA